MKREGAPLMPLQAARLDWREAGTPYCTEFSDLYYSAGDGLEESRYTFLSGNQLPDRWRSHPSRHFCIAETGFGTGLNFLLTWQAWRELGNSRPTLHYVSVERFPLHKADLQRALDAWPALAPVAALLLRDYPPALPGCHRLLFDEGRVRLDLHLGDAQEILPELAQRHAGLVDAWYLDGFAPARNADMWSLPLLGAVAALSRPGATLATFTAAGEVRRALQANGFEVNRVAGFGRKREALRGRLAAASAVAADGQLTPWDIPAHTTRRGEDLPPSPRTALVLGAGLAGCSVARALADRGLRVTVLDQGAVADAASGNPQGILYTRLSRQHSTLVDFALLSYRYALCVYASMLREGSLRAGVEGDLCGCFHSSSKAQDLESLAKAFRGLEDFACVVDARTASEHIGIQQPHDGYWFTGSGWLDPRAVCRAMLAQTNIHTRTHCGTLRLRYQGGQWQAIANNSVVAAADVAIIATGTETLALEQTAWLPLRGVRGQTTQLASSGPLTALRAAVCHTGYIAPASNGTHCIGSSFDVDDEDSSPRSSDHAGNLEKLFAALPAMRAELAEIDTAALTGRVGQRCASPDYLPLVGPVPDVEAFNACFAGLRRNARQYIGQQAPCLPGLYVSTAHGSRGLTSTPLAAETLASMICDEPLPLERTLSRALSPARFLVRELMRGGR